MPVKLALVGAGNIGREHIRNLALLKDVMELVAVADNFEESRREARELLDKCGFESCRVCETSDEVLKADDVQAIVIATPNFHHIDAIRQAAQSGKALMIEKPLCTTLADCREAAELAKASGQLWWVGMEYRYIPSIERLIREVTSGTVGSLKMLSIREHRFPFLTKVKDWNRFNEMTGGTLVEKCCHFFDLMLLMMDAPPVRVFGTGGQDVNHIDEDYEGRKPDILDNAYVCVDFANGSRACLDLCMFAEASRNQEEIIAVGDGGKLEAFAPSHGTTQYSPESPNFVIGLRNGASPGRDPPKPQPVSEMHIPIDPELMAAGHHCGATYTELKNFCEAVSAGTLEAQVSVGDGLRAVALGIAAQISIAERRVVEMSELGLGEFFEGDGPMNKSLPPGVRSLKASSGGSRSMPADLSAAAEGDLDADGFGLAFYPNNMRTRSSSPPTSLSRRGPPADSQGPRLGDVAQVSPLSF